MFCIPVHDEDDEEFDETKDGQQEKSKSKELLTPQNPWCVSFPVKF